MVKTREQQSEIEHYFKSIESYAGYLADVNMWWQGARGVDGMFSYEMKVLKGVSMSLLVFYYGLNGALLEPVDRTFDILIDNQLLHRETSQATGLPEVVDISYTIPSELLQGLEVNEDGTVIILVSFKNTSLESVVGGI